MSDTELDVSSLGSADEGSLVFPGETEGKEDGDWETAGEEEEEERPPTEPLTLPPTPSVKEETAEAGEPGPLLVVPTKEELEK